MKLTNPIGRKIDDVVKPLACMCSGAYSTAKGDDGCFKCGCGCSSADYSAGNSKSAFWTIRKSGDIE